MKTLQCRVCKNNKPLTMFKKDTKYKGGYNKRCRTCESKYQKEYREKNAQLKKENDKKYYLKNKNNVLIRQKRYYKKNKNTKIKKYLTNNKAHISKRYKTYCAKNKLKLRATKRLWVKNNKVKIAQYAKNRKKKNNIQEKLKIKLRSRMNQAIKVGYKKAGSAIKDLGCSMNELKTHLEKQFYDRESGETMKWENYGLHGWHIDHIIPLSSFDLSDRAQFLKAAHYTNLQPLWAEHNISKGNKLNYEK